MLELAPATTFREWCAWLLAACLGLLSLKKEVFAKIDSKLDKIDAKLDGIMTHQAGLAERVAWLEGREEIGENTLPSGMHN